MALYPPHIPWCSKASPINLQEGKLVTVGKLISVVRRLGLLVDLDCHHCCCVWEGGNMSEWEHGC